MRSATDVAYVLVFVFLQDLIDPVDHGAQGAEGYKGL